MMKKLDFKTRKKINIIGLTFVTAFNILTICLLFRRGLTLASIDSMSFQFGASIVFLWVFVNMILDTIRERPEESKSDNQ